MNKNKKILVLSCGTGGGHNSAALAIQESLLNRNISTDFVEYLDIINSKVKTKVNNLYLKSTNQEGKVFKIVYHLGELYQKTNFKSPVYRLNSLNRKKLYKYITENNYDYVITTHLFAAQALTAIKNDYDIHFLAVATDYTCIPFWEETNPDYFIIPHSDLIDDFKSKGISENKLLPYGIPVSKTYITDYDKDDFKKFLNYDLTKKYILILSGSMGFGNILGMLEELLENIDDCNFIVSCGNNTKLYENLKSLYKDSRRVIPLSFTKKISEYMKASDIILSKPGGLTSTEIASLNKPFIHTMPIPGCENYNANFFSSRGMSLKCSSISDVISNTKKLLADEKLQLQMIENQKKYIRKDTCDKIYDLILKHFNEKGI